MGAQRQTRVNEEATFRELHLPSFCLLESAAVPVLGLAVGDLVADFQRIMTSITLPYHGFLKHMQKSTLFKQSISATQAVCMAEQKRVTGRERERERGVEMDACLCCGCFCSCINREWRNMGGSSKFVREQSGWSQLCCTRWERLKSGNVVLSLLLLFCFCFAGFLRTREKLALQINDGWNSRQSFETVSISSNSGQIRWPHRSMLSV